VVKKKKVSQREVGEKSQNSRVEVVREQDVNRGRGKGEPSSPGGPGGAEPQKKRVSDLYYVVGGLGQAVPWVALDQKGGGDGVVAGRGKKLLEKAGTAKKMDSR